MKKAWAIVAAGLACLAFFVFHGIVPREAGMEKPRASRTIRDMAGREVVVPCGVSRAVTSLYPIATQLVFLVGAQERLSGVSGMDVNEVMTRIYPPIRDIYQPAQTDSGDISREEIIRMRPDVVFTHMRNARANDYADLGIATFCLVLETPDELIRGVELVGEVMGCRARAARIAGYYRDKLAYIRERTAHVRHRKKVYFAGPAMLSTAGGDYYQNFVIEYAGGVNVAREGHGGWCSVSVEHLLSWNPDFIFIGKYGTARVKDFTRDRRLAGINAVRNGKVFMSRSFIGSWDIPTPESLLGIMWLASRLYPEEVRFDMAREMTEFYRTCYGYTPTGQEIAAVLEAP